jgi:4-hydroxyphenylpyruvate dioxygenase
MLRWSIATVCMGGALEGKLSAAAKAGFRAVEIFENDLTFFSGKPRDVRSMVSDLGLEIVALQPMRDFEAMPEAIRTRNFERAARKFDLMAELGARLLCLCSNVSEEAIDDPSRASADLAELADRARRCGFSLGYEALAWGRHVRDWNAAWEIVRSANCSNLGIVLDSFHACARGNPIEPMSTIPPDRIALVQVADAPALQMDPLSLSRHYRCYPGQGDFPVVDYLDAVTRAGYRGPVSLEIFNDQFRGASASSIALDGIRSLLALGENLNAARVARGESSIPDWPPLPRVPEVGGVEFVEFATSDVDHAGVTNLLEGLGFVRAGHHRSKDVDLYQQGGVSIVVNSEREGFAHSFNTLHGPSVCAIAIGVDSVEAAQDRAKALGAPIYIGRIGPGEALIPAVGGVEGSLIYFVNRHSETPWRNDFEPVAGASPSDALRAIDHLSNVVRRSEFLTWSLFYKTILGFRAEPAVEVADPHGAFYSRSLRSPNGAVRIPLNVSDGGATVVTRFIDAFGGSGFQQIALSTDNIFDFVESARSHGVAFLPIPDNYYDDLAARFDLEAAILEKIRRLGILYDRDKGGEFFHIYTPTFEHRFFFEIVERRNYDLFGAANTPVRLAAQARLDEGDERFRGSLRGLLGQ